MNDILKDLRVNERIRARQVRLIDHDGTQHGVVTLQEALAIAKKHGLDLLEVSPAAEPPVCKVMDYGKYKYEQGKRERDSQKKQRMTELKTIRMRPGTDEHDFMFKYKNALKFLQAGHKVKIMVIFRAREITHPEFARESLNKIADLTRDSGIGKIEKPPLMEGRAMTMLLAPADSKDGKKSVNNNEV